MANLNLGQVSGSEIVAEAAQSIGQEYQVMEIVGWNFGDPELLQDVSSKWIVDAAKGVRDALALFGDPQSKGNLDKKEAKQTWPDGDAGSAASIFWGHEDILEHNHGDIEKAMNTVGDQLSKLAAEMSKMYADALWVMVVLIEQLLELLWKAWSQYKAVSAAVANNGTNKRTNPASSLVSTNGVVVKVQNSNQNPQLPAGMTFQQAVQDPNVKKQVWELIKRLLINTILAIYIKDLVNYENTVVPTIARALVQNNGQNVLSKLDQVPDGQIYPKLPALK